MSKPSDSAGSKKRKIDSGKTSTTKKPRTVQKKVEAPTTIVTDDATKAALSVATTFAELNLSEPLQKSLNGQDATTLAPIQRQAIPALLTGQDVVAVSDSGRDAMLSFLVPAVAILEKHKFSSRHGTGALVIVPSRETAIEMSKIASELLEGTTHSSGMIMDGANKSTEAEKLERGINLLIATPDRLLAHIKETIGFTFKNTKALCIYDAGAFATLGLEKTLRDILPRLPKKQRLTMVLGTSQSDELNSIAQLACRSSALKECTEVSAAIEESKEPQGYVTVDADKRFLLLNSFLKKFQQKKVIVVMSSTASVQYHAEALNRLNTPVSEVHGGQNAKIRAATFARFVKETEGTLIITDEATRSLEMPTVDWVIQYDPPRSIKDFIQRRGAFKGRAVLFVQPSEIAFVEELKKTGIVTEEFDFPKKALINVQKQLEKLVKTVYELHCTAKDGFRSFLQEYNLHPDSQIFDATTLDVTKVAKTFGFDMPPRVDVRTVVEEKVDKAARPYGPAKASEGVKRKA